MVAANMATATAHNRPNTGRRSPTILELLSTGKREIEVPKGIGIFSQGDISDAIYFVHSGKVKVSVVSPEGKEAILGIMGPGDFLGEESLLGRSRRLSTASAMALTKLFRVEGAVMRRALHAQPEISARFMASLLDRTMERERDLCDQLFNHSEGRLRRALLKLARRHGRGKLSETIVPAVNHQVLAEMVGTTRPRITHFMNKLRSAGMIDYDRDRIVITKRLIRGDPDGA